MSQCFRIFIHYTYLRAFTYSTQLQAFEFSPGARHFMVSYFAIAQMIENDIIVYAPYVLLLFLTVPLVGMQCVIVVFPDHAHLRFESNKLNKNMTMRWLTILTTSFEFV